MNLIINEGDIITIEIRVKVKSKPKPIEVKPKPNKRAPQRKYVINGNIATHRDMIHHGLKKVISTEGWISVNELQKITEMRHPDCGNAAHGEAGRGALRKSEVDGYYGKLEGYEHVYSWEDNYSPKPRPLRKDWKLKS